MRSPHPQKKELNIGNNLQQKVKAFSSYLLINKLNEFFNTNNVAKHVAASGQDLVRQVRAEASATTNNTNVSNDVQELVNSLVHERNLN